MPLIEIIEHHVDVGATSSILPSNQIDHDELDTMMHQNKLSILNSEQQRVHDIIEKRVIKQVCTTEIP